MDGIKLSILIPTVYGREEKLKALMDILEPQVADKREVQILTYKDNKTISIGKKRQELLEAAIGEYVVFIDDDDLVSEEYVNEILNNIGSDAIGFLIQCTFDGRNKCIARASSKYKDWGEHKDGFRYVRSIYHKTPVRRELALKAGFKDMRFGEDYDYSMRLNPLIQTEAFINRIMYFYQYEEEDFNSKYGIV